MAEDVLGETQQLLAGISQGHGAAAAVKQFHPEGQFQGFNLFGNRRLADVQHLRRRREAAFAGDGMKRPEPIVIHKPKPALLLV